MRAGSRAGNALRRHRSRCESCLLEGDEEAAHFLIGEASELAQEVGAVDIGAGARASEMELNLPPCAVHEFS